MTMKFRLSKFSVVCLSATFSLLPLSINASTPPSQRIPSSQNKTTTITPTKIPAANSAVIPQTPTAVPTQISSDKPTIAPQTPKIAPAQTPEVSTTNTLQTPATNTTVTPTATPTKTPATKTTATATDNKNLATRLVLNLKERRVYAYKDDKVIVSYPVAVGKKGWETPTGNFKVIQMVKDPIWENPWNGKIVPASPKGPIGERWIGFWSDGKNTIGFHGTPTINSLGQAASHGCVRMKNEDVKVLFEMIEPGTPVVVVPK